MSSATHNSIVRTASTRISFSLGALCWLVIGASLWIAGVVLRLDGRQFAVLFFFYFALIVLDGFLLVERGRGPGWWLVGRGLLTSVEREPLGLRRLRSGIEVESVVLSRFRDHNRPTLPSPASIISGTHLEGSSPVLSRPVSVDTALLMEGFNERSPQVRTAHAEAASGIGPSFVIPSFVTWLCINNDPKVVLGTAVVFGRAPAPVINGDDLYALPDMSRELSKNHFRVSTDTSEAVFFEDLGSTNGTWFQSANGEVIQLSPGIKYPMSQDVAILAGDFQVTYRKVGLQ